MTPITAPGTPSIADITETVGDITMVSLPSLMAKRPVFNIHESLQRAASRKKIDTTAFNLLRYSLLKIFRRNFARSLFIGHYLNKRKTEKKYGIEWYLL